MKTKRNQSDAISNKFPKTSDSEQSITSANSSTNKTSIDSKLPPNIVENITPGNEIEIEEVIENDDHNNPNIPSRSSSISNNTYNNNEEKKIKNIEINTTERLSYNPVNYNLISVNVSNLKKLNIIAMKLDNKEKEKEITDTENKALRLSINSANKEITKLKLTSIGYSALVTAQKQTDRNEAEILLKNCVEHQAATNQLLEQKVITLSETLKSTQILAQQEKKDSSTHKAELATIHKAELAVIVRMNYLTPIVS